MATTAEDLEAITSGGKWENLATAVLRLSDPLCNSVIQTGVNASGETIKAPVDAFCQIPGSQPPHFVMVAHTTTDRQHLKSKWLDDLEKAAKKAQTLRLTFSDARFTIVLTSNQRVPTYAEGMKKRPQEERKDILDEVYEKAKTYGLTVDPWEQTRFSHFLDNTPDGHWLRRQYLGVDAQLLSDALLRHICVRSLQLYRVEMIGDPDRSIERESTRELSRTIRSDGVIRFLVGLSGFGKSAIAYQTLQAHIRGGGFGLWVPASLIRDSLSLESLLDKVLRELQPSLVADAGAAALGLCSSQNKLLLVVDDLSRTDQPVQWASRVFNWSRYLTSQGMQGASVFLICPLWSQHWATLVRPRAKEDEIPNLQLGPMTDTEATAAVMGALESSSNPPTEVEAKTIAAGLGNDPTLIYMLGSLVTSGVDAQSSLLPYDLVDRYVTNAIQDAVEWPGSDFVPAECRQALMAMAEAMVNHGTVAPTWGELDMWLDKQELQALKQLASHGVLCRTSKDGMTLLMRHDRLRDHLLTKALSDLMDEGPAKAEFYTDPFYSGMTGAVLAETEVDETVLESIRSRNPAALIEALRIFGTPTKLHHHQIVSKLHEWVHTEIVSGRVPEAVISDCLSRLLNADGEVVLNITAPFPDWWLVLLVRLRSGCARSGARYCAHQFESGARIEDERRDQVVKHAKTRHGKVLLGGLGELLSTPGLPDTLRSGALGLAGLVASAELSAAVRQCWELAIAREYVLPAAIWAGTQCCGDAPQLLLAPLLDFWETLSDTKDSHGDSARGRVVDSVPHLLRRRATVPVIQFLMDQVRQREGLPIAALLSEIDVPDVVEFLVRRDAENERIVTGTTAYPFFLVMQSISRRGQRSDLSTESMNRLVQLWTASGEDDLVRSNAFKSWSFSASRTDIPLLQRACSDELLRRNALQKRAKIGDLSAVPEFIAMAKQEPRWWSYAGHVWSEPVRAAVAQALKELDGSIPEDYSGGKRDIHHVLADLMMDIPANDAEHLLSNAWQVVRQEPLFIQSALYVGTQECLQMAAGSIERCPIDVPLFTHVDLHFGIRTERQNHVLPRHILALEPYLERIEGSSLVGLAEACQQLGMFGWARTHLMPRLTDEWRSRIFPTDDDLSRELDRFASEPNGRWRVHYWVEEFHRRGDGKDRVMHVVGAWLSRQISAAALAIAAECVQLVGERRDLPMLSTVAINNSQPEIDLILAGARFAVFGRTLQ